jgi:hypothetical protein
MRRVVPGGLALAAMILGYSVSVGAFAAGMYDGTYHGTLTADGGNAPNCAKQAPVQMTISDNRLEYNHMGNAAITANVGADGSFSGSAQSKYTVGRTGPMMTTLDGKIAGGQIQAEAATGNYCKYKLQLKKF